MKHSLGLALLMWGAVLCRSGFAEAVETPAVGQSATTTEVRSELRRRTFELHPQITILSFNTLTLVKNGREFSYNEPMRGIPLISFNLSTPIGATGDFDWFGLFRFGYGTKFSEIPIDDGATTQGVRLHAIPTAFLVKARYLIPAVPSIKPALLAGVGNHFFYQSARDPQYSSSYFIPSALFGLNLSLFDPGITTTDWFGGFNFGVTYSHGLASTNRLRAISFDLGMVIIL